MAQSETWRETQYEQKLREKAGCGPACKLIIVYSVPNIAYGVYHEVALGQDFHRLPLFKVVATQMAELVDVDAGGEKVVAWMTALHAFAEEHGAWAREA